MSLRTRPARATVSLHQAVLDHEPVRLDALQHEIDAFTAEIQGFRASLTQFAERAAEEIKARNEMHAKFIRQFADDSEQLKAETEKYKTAEAEALDAMEVERKAEEKAQAEVNALRQKLAEARESERATANEKIDCNSNIVRLRSKHDQARRVLAEQAARITPMLAFMEPKLQFSMEPIERNVLLFRFRGVDETSPEREFTLVVDVSQQEYKVPTSTPLLPSMPGLLETLNQTRDFFGFLKETRVAFRMYAQEEQRTRG